MDKNVKLKLINKTPWLLEEYCPAAQFANPIAFTILSKKFEMFENWIETVKIPREEFEQLLNRDKDLVDAYLELYSKKATFYKCIISGESYHFQYFIMKKNESLVLLFYRTVEIIEI